MGWKVFLKEIIFSKVLKYFSLWFFFFPEGFLSFLWVFVWSRLLHPSRMRKLRFSSLSYAAILSHRRAVVDSFFFCFKFFLTNMCLVARTFFLFMLWSIWCFFFYMLYFFYYLFLYRSGMVETVLNFETYGCCRAGSCRFYFFVYIRHFRGRYGATFHRSLGPFVSIWDWDGRAL